MGVADLTILGSLSIQPSGLNAAIPPGPARQVRGPWRGRLETGRAKRTLVTVAPEGLWGEAKGDIRRVKVPSREGECGYARGYRDSSQFLLCVSTIVG